MDSFYRSGISLLHGERHHPVGEVHQLLTVAHSGLSKCQAALNALGQRINRQPTAGNPRCLKLNMKNQLAARGLTGRRFIPACWAMPDPSFLANACCV